MTGEVTIYHNPRCSKSRATLELLHKQGIEPTIVEYLKTPPSQAELTGLLDLLGMQPRELMRLIEHVREVGYAMRAPHVEPRNSNTIRRAWSTRSERVCTTMPVSTGREQAGTSGREPSTSTTHSRQAFFGVIVSPKHSVGISPPRPPHACRIVVPTATVTAVPSIVAATVAMLSGVDTCSSFIVRTLPA